MDYLSVAHALGLKRNFSTRMEFIEFIRGGIPKKSIAVLAERLQVAAPELVRHLHVSDRTIKRYAENKRLSVGLSDRLQQIAQVYARSLEVFADEAKAAAWLKRPNIALGGAAPIDLLDTSSGIEMILDELTRMEHGVFA